MTIFSVPAIRIVDTNLTMNYARIRRMDIVKRIIIHHTASGDVSAAEVHRWHLRRGWAAIGYHYLIRRAGIIEIGRPEYLRGVHAGKIANIDSIGIAVTGNFNNDIPSIQQMRSLTMLIMDIRRRYGDRITIHRHSEYMTTRCPGRGFPWLELMDRLDGLNQHTVVRGETLWSIAQTRLGDGRRWREISTINGLTSEVIIPGQVLILPDQ